MVEATNLHRLHHISISYIYKVFYHIDMLWMGTWVGPNNVALVPRGLDIRKIGVGLSLSNAVMSWLRQGICKDCIPLPYHMYTKCFITLICCGWAWVH